MPSRYLVDEIPARPWAGQRAFIIGGGSSLKGFDFEQLRGEKIVAINRAVEYVPFAEIMFALDQKLYGLYSQRNKKLDWEKFESFRGLRVWVEAPGGKYDNDVLLVKMKGKHGLSTSLQEGLYTGGNSGHAALQLAVCLGATTVCLLGFDMDKAGNFHSGYPSGTNSDPETRGWIDGFNELAPRLEAAGIKVINLNQKSKLQCFPFGELKTKSTITVITPTGDRPLAFWLCQRWMMYQTQQPNQWLVIDDGKTPTTHIVPMQYVRRKPRADDPKHTLVVNLKKALPLITGDKVIIWEDDEYYAPDYIERMARELDSHEVVGIKRSKYYHLSTGGYLQIGNGRHASLAQTAFRRSFLPELKTLWDGDMSLDMRIWKKAGGRGHLFDDTASPLYLGIKGLPGRLGIGKGHDPFLYRNTKDTPDRAKLKAWVPKDYQVYLDIIGRKLTLAAPLPVTGITVCWNTKDLIERAYNSIRKFYPAMPIIIVDGSDVGDPCAAYVRGLASDITTIIQPGYNVGHGRGMCMGIEKAATPYALMFDSDIELLEPCLPAMLAMMEADTFGVGYLEDIGYDGFRYKINPHPEGSLPCLHPYWQLISIENYKKFHPYVHHGMPVYLAMLDIHKRGLSSKILKQFPGLSNEHCQKDHIPRFVRHHSNGTGGMRIARGLTHIEGPWVNNRGQV